MKRARYQNQGRLHYTTAAAAGVSRGGASSSDDASSSGAEAAPVPWTMRGDGMTAAGASSRTSSAISSTRHYCRRRKRLVLGPLGLGNARRWFAVRKAQGPKLALGAAATVQLTGFWLALARGRSRSCPLMVARADARSAGHGRTTHSTKLVCRGGASRKVRHTPPKRRVPHGDAKKMKKKTVEPEVLTN